MKTKLKIDGPLSGHDALEMLRNLPDPEPDQVDKLWGGKRPSGGLRYKPLTEGPVRRMIVLKSLKGSNRPSEIIVTLLPSNEIEFREKHKQGRLRLSLETVIVIAAQAKATEALKERKRSKKVT